MGAKSHRENGDTLKGSWISCFVPGAACQIPEMADLFHGHKRQQQPFLAAKAMVTALDHKPGDLLP